MHPSFTGLSAFPLSPVDDRGRVMGDRLGQFLNRIATAGADSIGLLGSTGGYVYLTGDQRRRILRIAVESVAGRVPLIVGVGAMTTETATALAVDAERAGADGLLLAPVSYQRLTADEVFAHFQTVSAATALPLCIYNNPGTTGFSFDAGLIGRLAGLPHVAAVKMPLPADGDYLAEMAGLRGRVPADFSIGYSGDWGARDALLAGADCWYSVIAGLLPVPALALLRATQAGDTAEAARIDRAFAPIWQLFRTWGSYRVMFALAERLGLGGFAPPRPVLPIPPAAHSQVEAALQALTEAGVT